MLKKIGKIKNIEQYPLLKRGSAEWLEYKRNNPIYQKRGTAFFNFRKKLYTRNYDYIRRYNLTLQEYETLLKIQNGHCGICDRTISGGFKGKGKKLSVDHNHKTNEIRGLLCATCNQVMERVDNCPNYIENLILYIRVNSDNYIELVEE